MSSDSSLTVTYLSLTACAHSWFTCLFSCYPQHSDAATDPTFSPSKDGFCYGNSIRQFHEIRTQSGPKEDPNTDAYVLGKFPGANAASTPRRSASSDQPLKLLPGAAELVQSNAIGFAGNGLAELLSAEHEPDIHEDEDENGKRYLVQHWTGGTTCDMTGLERRTEVQVRLNSPPSVCFLLAHSTSVVHSSSTATPSQMTA